MNNINLLLIILLNYIINLFLLNLYIFETVIYFEISIIYFLKIFPLINSYTAHLSRHFIFTRISITCSLKAIRFMNFFSTSLSIYIFMRFILSVYLLTACFLKSIIFINNFTTYFKKRILFINNSTS